MGRFDVPSTHVANGGDVGAAGLVELWTATAPGLTVTLSRSETGSKITVKGEVDLGNTQLLERALDEAIEIGGRLRFDLSATTFMDSIGLGVLVQAYRRFGQVPEAISIWASRNVGRVLRISGLDRIMAVRDLGAEAEPPQD